VSLAELRDELDKLGEPPPEHRGPRPSIAHATPKAPAPVPPARERATGRTPALPRDTAPAAVARAEPIREVPPGPIPDPTIATPASLGAGTPTVATPIGRTGQPSMPVAPDAGTQGSVTPPPDGSGGQGGGDKKRRRRRRRGRRGDGPPGQPRPES
jgi:hypothetical protein